MTSFDPPTTHAPAGVAPTTVMQLPVHPDLVPLYLGNVAVAGRFEPFRAGGFPARMQDIEAERASDVAAAYALDHTPGWPTEGPVFLLRFPASWPGLFTTAFGGRTTQAAAKMGGIAAYPAPFLGTGYFDFAPTPIPEYSMPLTELPAAAELWRVAEDGAETRLGAYLHRGYGWLPSAQAAPFGPTRFFPGPRPGFGAIRRGLRARWHGHDLDADFGPEPGLLTLHPHPGQRPPDGFAEQYGCWTKIVADAECEQVSYVRLRTRWRGGAFELLDQVGDELVLHYVGENQEEAEQLGLTAVGFRSWRVLIPRTELGEVGEDTVEVGIQPHFAVY